MSYNRVTGLDEICFVEAMPKLTLNCSELYPNPIIDDPKNYKVAQKLIKIQICQIYLITIKTVTVEIIYPVFNTKIIQMILINIITKLK